MIYCEKLGSQRKKGISISVRHLPQEISQVRKLIIDRGAKINMLLFCPLVTADRLWFKFSWKYPAI